MVEVPVNVYVDVPEELTRKGDLAAPDMAEYMPLSTKDKLLHITALYHWNTTRALQCYGNLDEIAGLGRDPISN